MIHPASPSVLLERIRKEKKQMMQFAELLIILLLSLVYKVHIFKNGNVILYVILFIELSYITRVLRDEITGVFSKKLNSKDEE